MPDYQSKQRSTLRNFLYEILYHLRKFFAIKK
nr:MAG TPA: hypothetical protein [Caudoviricetes sp.]